MCPPCHIFSTSLSRQRLFSARLDIGCPYLFTEAVQCSAAYLQVIRHFLADHAAFTNIGAGGRFAVSSTSIIVNKEQAESSTFDALTLCGGAYFSYPLSSRWLVGSKLLGGYVHYPQLRLTHQSVPARNGFCMGSGASLTFRAKEHYGIRFFLDYNLLPSHSKQSGEYMNMLTVGSSFMITL